MTDGTANIDTERATAGGDDLRATLAAEFDKADAAPEDAVTPSETAAPPAKTTAEKTESDGRVRDPATGQFAPKPKSEAAPEKAVPETKIPAQDDPAKATDTAPSTAPVAGPPVSWAADAKAEWSKLSPATQTAVLKREREVSDGFRQASEKTRQLETVLSPLAQETQRLGIDVGQGLNALLAAHHKLNRDPASAIAELAQRYGVDLGTLATREPVSNSQVPAPAAAPHDPRLDYVTSWIQSQEQQRSQSVEDSVVQFAQSPGHEHFDAVATEIMALIPAIKAANPRSPPDKVLQDAYDRAVWANPTTRSAVQDAQNQAAEAKRIAESKTHSEKARRAGSSIAGSAASAPVVAADQTRSVRQELEAAFAA